MHRAVRPLRRVTQPRCRSSATGNTSSTTRRETRSSSSKEIPNKRPLQPPSQSKTQGPITWRALAVFGAAGTAALAYYGVEKQKRIEEISRPRTIGRAAIGGPFELVDGNGNPFTDQQLLGRWSLIYFGFTMCPDICPAELSKVAEALEILRKKGRNVSSEEGAIMPVFISVDPGRDSPARSSEYAKEFHPAFVGLSGTEEQVKSTAKAYRVYYSRDDSEGDDYLVDHSIITYLMDPSGEFKEFYGQNSNARDIAARIEQQLLSWKG